MEPHNDERAAKRREFHAHIRNIIDSRKGSATLPHTSPHELLQLLQLEAYLQMSEYDLLARFYDRILALDALDDNARALPAETAEGPVESAAEEPWEVVEVFGHQKHIGQVRTVYELGETWLQVRRPEFVLYRRRYPEVVIKLSPRALFRRHVVTEAEAREQIEEQTPTPGLGVPLPGLRLELARVALGLSFSEAAKRLGIELVQITRIESCEEEIGEQLVNEWIAQLNGSNTTETHKREVSEP